MLLSHRCMRRSGLSDTCNYKYLKNRRNENEDENGKNAAESNGTGQKVFYHKSRGIDGILVTVGLCIIALLLCVVMKDSLTSFIQAIVTAMQNKAIGILG